ncbi:hypothetical protein C2G38_2202289 [Gigaspora rosea]|uniref:Uncharacterized protein n=1 Tax=Gigaspora rosea TaxID=44941 RepID=A0A397URN1_9GLOM|nr:hypothetical protein C2G38_2202289 [Gigaspora rosea]
MRTSNIISNPTLLAIQKGRSWRMGIRKDKQKAFNYYLRSAEATNILFIVCLMLIMMLDTLNKENVHIAMNITRVKRGVRFCDPDIIIQGWTSGNKYIDDCVKEFQLRISNYHCMIEWVPFDRFAGIKIIDKEDNGDDEYESEQSSVASLHSRPYMTLTILMLFQTVLQEPTSVA